MIKIDKGSMEFSGARIELYVELGLLLREVYQREIISHDEFEILVKSAKMSEEEMNKQMSDKLDDKIKFLDSMIEILEKINRGGKSRD